MTSAAQILKSKVKSNVDPAVHTIEPTAPVFDAAERMAEKNIGARE